MVGAARADELCAQLGGYGAARVLSRRRARRGSRSRSSTRWPRSSSAHGFGYALFGGGLLGFEIGAGLAARLGAGVAMEVTGGARRGRAADRASGRSSATRRSRRSSSAGRSGSSSAGSTRSTPRRRATRAAPVEDVAVALLGLLDARADGQPRRAARRERRHRGRRRARRGRPRARPRRGLRAVRGARAGVRARRRRRRDARGRRRRLVPLRRPDRPDRQDRRAEALPRRRHLRARSSTRSACRARRTSSRSTRTQNAPIFEFADLGIVGDLNKILPKLTAAIRAHKAAAIVARHAGVVPADFPPPVDSRREFIRRELDGEDDRIEVGVAIVGGGTAGLACANRLLALLADDPRDGGAPRRGAGRGDREGQGCGGHSLSGAVMRPQAAARPVPAISTARRGGAEGFAFGEVTKEAVYLLPNGRTQAADPDAAAVSQPRQRGRLGRRARRASSRRAPRRPAPTS